jgi:hypothetical protein
LKVQELILEEHKDFKEFLYYLLKHDPEVRPSAQDALNHKFFTIQFEDEVICSEKTQDHKNRASTSVSD